MQITLIALCSSSDNETVLILMQSKIRRSNSFSPFNLKQTVMTSSRFSTLGELIDKLGVWMQIINYLFSNFWLFGYMSIYPESMRVHFIRGPVYYNLFETSLQLENVLLLSDAYQESPARLLILCQPRPIFPPLRSLQTCWSPSWCTQTVWIILFINILHRVSSLH